jgi:molybdopterin synthase sulfur carrier subunit
MAVRVLYFAWVRERIGKAEETLSPPAGVATVGQLIGWLAGRGPEYAAAFAKPGVIRAALDQTHATHDTPIAAAREIALFPPVTGG